jgi:hypothetical protein
VLLPSQWIFLPKLLYACSLSLSKPPQKLIMCLTHTQIKQGAYSSKPMVLKCFIRLHYSPSMHEFCQISAHV